MSDCALRDGQLLSKLNIRGHSEASQNTLDVSGGGVLSKSNE